MKNVEKVIEYINRALETGDISDLQVAYEIITENERRDAEDIQQFTKRAPEIDDFEQDIEFAERQREIEDRKIKKERDKIVKHQGGGSFVTYDSPRVPRMGPTPRKRTKRKKGERKR